MFASEEICISRAAQHKHHLNFSAECHFSIYRQESQNIWAAPETELLHPGAENFPGVDACSPRKRTSFNALVRGGSTEEDTLSSLTHPLQQQTPKSFPSAKYRSASCVFDKILHTETCWGKSRDHLYFYLTGWGCSHSGQDISFKLHPKAIAGKGHCKGHSLQMPQESL